MEKLRDQYKAQKEEEETKRQFYHSPGTAHHDGIEGDDGSGGDESSEGQLEGSAEIGSNFEQTPEPSPALNLREMTDTSAGRPAIGQRVLPEPAVKPKVAPPVAPRSAGHSKTAPQVNGGSHPAYNPYPPPTQAAPPSPSQVERLPSPQQPAPAPPQPIAPPVAPPSSPPGSDKEALFAFAWYHGSIPRDEALRRLENVGGFDG